MAPSLLQQQFLQDQAWQDLLQPHNPEKLVTGRIHGCHAFMLPPHADERGHRFEILTTRAAPLADPLVNVYQVHALPGSVRGWNHHARQSGCLCFSDGQFKLVLIDIPEDSPTAGARLELALGEYRPALLVIPPFVVHGVGKIGPHRASFLNFPTRTWDPADPDKFRLPITSPLIAGGW